MRGEANSVEMEQDEDMQLRCECGCVLGNHGRRPERPPFACDTHEDCLLFNLARDGGGE